MVLADSDRVSPAPPYSGYHGGLCRFAYGTLTLCGLPSHAVLLRRQLALCGPTTPTGTPVGLASSAFARHYSRNHYCFLFLCLLRCFSSAGSRRFDVSSTHQVAPFGHLRIIGRLHLPAAFRSLPRPSSPPGAKASPIRPYSASNSLLMRQDRMGEYLSDFTTPQSNRLARCISFANPLSFSSLLLLQPCQ